MSLAAVRDNWRFLIRIVLIFLAVAIAGPFALVALVGGTVFAAGSLGAGGGEIILVAGLAFIGVCLAWLFIVLAIGNRRTAPGGGASPVSYSDGKDG